MTYYEHHLGDCMRDTAHLYILEYGVYRRLIEANYIKEAPLPAAFKDCWRLVRAQSKQERDAVQSVLEEFFKLTEEGWFHKRCHEEISRYQDKQAKARKSAEARWGASKLQSDGNANASADAMRTHSEGNAHQSPVTSHQSPDLKPIQETSPLIHDGDDTPRQPGEWFGWFNRHHGTQYDAHSLHDRKKLMAIFTQWQQSGVTTEQVNAAVKRAFEDAKEPIANLAAYVDRVLSSITAQQRITTHKPPDARAIVAQEIFGTKAGETNGRTLDHEEQTATTGSDRQALPAT